MTVPRFRQAGPGRWRVEKRAIGWVAVSPQGHVVRQPAGQAAAYSYALGWAHSVSLLRYLTPPTVVIGGSFEPVKASRVIEKVIQADRAMDAIGGY